MTIHWFKRYHKLQGSQTPWRLCISNWTFKRYHKLQGSQTDKKLKCTSVEFKRYHKLQGSQTGFTDSGYSDSLRDIINYKVLKHQQS